MSLTVVPHNDAPVVSDQTVTTAEDTPLVISLGHDGDPDVVQTLVFNHIVDPSHGTLEFNSITGQVTYTPDANYSGSDSFGYSLSDDATAGGAALTGPEATVTISIEAVNDPPTLDPIVSPVTINEGAGPQSVTLSGISAGGGEDQALQVTATSNNPSLIPNPAVSYTSPSGSGVLTYEPVAGQTGTAVLTVLVVDAGLDGTLNTQDDAFFTRQFTVTVQPDDHPPTLDAIADPAPLTEDNGSQMVYLTGISAGGESQGLRATAVSGNTALLPSISVGYTAPASEGWLYFVPAANQSGTAVVTVTVTDAGVDGVLDTSDDGSVSREFTVTVNPVNDTPIAVSQTVGTQEDAQVVISLGEDGDPEYVQTLTLNLTALPSHGTLEFNSMTGQVTHTPDANYSGSDSFRYSLTDDATAGGAALTGAEATVTLAIEAVNDLPTLDAISDPQPINEDAAEQTVGLSGISAGSGESQALRVTASRTTHR